MEIEEVKKLIPFYSAKTLSPKERAEVQEALKNSPELRDELAFCREARLATKAQAAYLAEGHLATEQIVDYAERAMTDPLLRTKAEAHFQSCTNCKEEYDIVMKTFPAPVPIPIVQPTILERVQEFFAAFKPLYVVPVAAMLVASFFLWRYFDTRNGGENIAGIITGSGDINFILDSQSYVRGRDSNVLPVLELTDGAKKLHLTLTILPDTLTATRYTVSLVGAQGTVKLPGSFPKTRGGIEQADSVKMSIDLTAVKLAPGNYTLYATEDLSSLPPGYKALPAEPYRFRVVRK
jgi:hypothetical protein